MPKGIPKAGKRKLDPAKNNGGKREGAGRPATLPEGTVLRTYRATPIEHTRLSACLRAMREDAGKDKDTSNGNPG